MSPLIATVIVDFIIPDADEAARHLRFATVLLQDAEYEALLPEVQLVGAVPKPPLAMKTEHSLAWATTSPILAPASAASLALRYLGIARAARIPRMATTIINSIRVKPLEWLLRFRRLRRSSS
jgi:hypothetical protein